jgi:hypothetical protein
LKSKQTTPPSCSLCGQYHLPVTACETGYVSDICAEKTRTGRDGTTRAVKTLQRSLRGKAEKALTIATGGTSTDELDYDIASAELLSDEVFQPQTGVAMLAGGEVRPQHLPDLVDTLAAPTAMALDASAHRLDLVTAMGTDIAAMALDASDTMKAGNSLEKMLANQLRKTLERLMARGIGESELLADLGHEHWQNKIALRMAESDVTSGSTQSHANQAFNNFCKGL